MRKGGEGKKEKRMLYYWFQWVTLKGRRLEEYSSKPWIEKYILSVKN